MKILLTSVLRRKCRVEDCIRVLLGCPSKTPVPITAVLRRTPCSQHGELGSCTVSLGKAVQHSCVASLPKTKKPTLVGLQFLVLTRSNSSGSFKSAADAGHSGWKAIDPPVVGWTASSANRFP